MQQHAMINNYLCLGSDPAIGWVLPHRGANYVPLQFLVFSVELHPWAMGEG